MRRFRENDILTQSYTTVVRIDTSYDTFYNFFKLNNRKAKDVTIDYEYNCKYCGTYHYKKVKLKNRMPEFCSGKCNLLYYWKKKNEVRDRLIAKSITKQEIADFYKKYNNFVLSEIYKYDDMYREDLIDWWNISVTNITYYTRNNYPIPYLRKAINHTFVNMKKKRKKEVFYDDLSMKDQLNYFGEVLNDRRI